MTDRLNGFTVVLKDDIREDDAAPIMEAIKQLRGVIDVRPIVANFESHMATQRVRLDLGRQIWNILYPEREEPKR